MSISGFKFPNCSFNNSENAPIHLLFSNFSMQFSIRSTCISLARTE